MAVVAVVSLVFLIMLTLTIRSGRAEGGALQRLADAEALADSLQAQRDAARAVSDSVAGLVEAQAIEAAQDSVRFAEWIATERRVRAAEQSHSRALADSLASVIDPDAAPLLAELAASHAETVRTLENEIGVMKAERAQLFERVATLTDLAAARGTEIEAMEGIARARSAQIDALTSLARPSLWSKIRSEISDPSLIVGLAGGLVLGRLLL